MANVEKISVALTPEMALMLKEAVGSGAYASSSELVREALREWRERRAYRAKAGDHLGEHWDVGLASGEAVDGPAAMARIKAKLAKAITSKVSA
jgi:antitoxin ParD1/3/4